MRITSYSVIFDFMPVAGLEPAKPTICLSIFNFYYKSYYKTNKKEPQTEVRGMN